LLSQSSENAVEEVKDFSKSGFLFQAQTPHVQKQILGWDVKKKKCLL
jgi:hypothetical protein